MQSTKRSSVFPLSHDFEGQSIDWGLGARFFMKRIEIILLMTLMAIGLAAQTPESAPKTDAAQAPAAARTAAPNDGVAAQESPGADEQSPVAQKPETEAANVSTSASASFSSLPGDVPASKTIPAANTELQSQVQEALSKNPSLSKCTVVVSASVEGIELTGNAGSSRERLAAWRLAESYARGKKVENHIVVNGQGGAAPPAAHPETPAPASNPAPSGAASPGSGQDNRQ